MNKKNEKNRGKRTRAAVLMLALCLTLLCGALPASAASGKPGRVKITSVSRKKGGRARVKYKRVPKADGYQIMLATNRKFTSGKIVADVRKGKTTSKTVKGLRTWKKYYVRVRAYRKAGQKKLYGKWSKIRALDPGVVFPPEDSDDDDGYEEDWYDDWEDDEDEDEGDEAGSPPAVEEETEAPLPPELEKPDDYYEKPEDREASAWGFSISIYSHDILYKAERNGNSASRTEDGGHVYTAEFYCDGGENWLRDVEFVAEDVTPVSYRKMYEAMGVPGGVTSKSEAVSTDCYGRILEPLDDSGETEPVRMKFAEAYVSLTLKARMATRVVKLTAEKDGKTLDTIYLTASGYSPQSREEYARQDLELYEAVRKRVESKLWKPGMSNLEKLRALQEYINTTTHYPREAIISKKYNPTFWENWSVDGLELYDSLASDTILSKTMAFQGGTTTCQAATMLLRAATEDLGLSELAGKDRKTAVEGVWVGRGSASSNPGNPWHETFYYQDPTGRVYSLDAQGMGFPGMSGEISCEAHRCREKIIPLG